MDGDKAERRALVVGGGLAGISAACALADRGIAVTLLERRPYLGGRTFSFTDKATGREIDNGQHIFMRCCTYYVDFLKRLGVFERTFLQDRMSVEIVGEDGRVSCLTSARLPAPLQFFPSFAAYKHLTLRDKLGMGRVGLTLLRMREDERLRLDGTSFYTWLKRRGQSERAIDNFWNVIILPTLNDDCRDVSAAQAIMVFREGFLKDASAADIGFSSVGLSSLLVKEATAYLEDRRGRVLLGRNASGVVGTANGADCIRTHAGEEYVADAYVLAVPPDRLLSLLPEGLRAHGFFARPRGLAMSPIVNLHLWFDRHVMDSSFATYLGSEVQWVFNRNAIAGQNGTGPPGDSPSEQHLVVSVSAAHKYIDMPKAELYHLLLDDLHSRLPASREAVVLHHTVIKERSATFSATPGSADCRLPARTPVPNLFLAGAWTDTGWPSTMESAVRSGAFCAEEVATALR